MLADLTQFLIRDTVALTQASLAVSEQLAERVT